MCIRDSFTSATPFWGVGARGHENQKHPHQRRRLNNGWVRHGRRECLCVCVLACVCGDDAAGGDRDSSGCNDGKKERRSGHVIADIARSHLACMR
eukprot:4358011-Pyramimonas_sp.AAC.1